MLSMLHLPSFLPPPPPCRCLKFLGARHPTLVLPIVPELLSTHPYFDTPEPDMDDPACILSVFGSIQLS